MFRILLILLTFFLSTSIAMSGKLQTITLGKTYDIAELDLIEFLKERSKQLKDDGTLSKVLDTAKKMIYKKVNNPESVYGITDAKEDKGWMYDPSITVKFDITTLDGKTLAKKGDIINPLDVVSLQQDLLFINGSNKKQIRFASERVKERNGNIKIILTSGSIIEISKLLKMYVYFDQDGVLTKKLNIQHVPAMVQQENKYLKIKEYAL